MTDRFDGWEDEDWEDFDDDEDLDDDDPDDDDDFEDGADDDEVGYAEAEYDEVGYDDADYEGVGYDDEEDGDVDEGAEAGDAEDGDVLDLDALDVEGDLDAGLTEVAVVSCPYCGEEGQIAIDPVGGDVQEYVEDCEVCCQPWSIRVTLDPGGGASVDVDTLDQG